MTVVATGLLNPLLLARGELAPAFRLEQLSDPRGKAELEARVEVEVVGRHDLDASLEAAAGARTRPAPTWWWASAGAGRGQGGGRGGGWRGGPAGLPEATAAEPARPM